MRCPMAPLLAWTASEVAQRSEHRTSPGNANSNSDSDNDNDDDDDGNKDENYTTITAVCGKLKVSTRAAHHPYRQRCRNDDMGHLLHDIRHVLLCMAYTSRVEKLLKSGRRSSSNGEFSDADDQACHDKVPSDEDSSDNKPTAD